VAAMIRKLLIWLGVLAAFAVGIVVFFIYPSSRDDDVVRVGISPYQDLAMIVNAEPLGLYKKYGTRLDLITMPWEDIPPSVATAGRAIDLGFGSFIEYLTKYEHLNGGSPDPVLFLYPAYAFKGGAFVTFKKEVPELNLGLVRDTQSPTVRHWLSFRIGAQRGSLYEMMLFDLATTHGVNFADVHIIDTPLDEGFLAAEQGSLDIAEAGLTQLTEAERRGGRRVLSMEDLGFADLTGFIVKKSVYEQRKRDIDNVIRMWFDSVAYVLSNVDQNSKDSLSYLDRMASTRYTLDEYKKALSQEYFPTTLAEARAQLVDASGKFSSVTIGDLANKFLVLQGTIKKATPLPKFPTIPLVQGSR
jgi:ABC-type nitrate/sulfonate/bicarbonate transport system substrate-binding protein